MVMAQGASSTGQGPSFVSRWSTCMAFRSGSMRISRAFWMPVATSTLWFSRTPSARISKATGSLSGA